MCIEIGLLQAFLDNEVKTSQREGITKHLAKCSACQERLQQLVETQQFTDELLSNYLTSFENPKTSEAWDHLHKTMLQAEPCLENKSISWNNFRRKGVFNMLNKYRGIAVAAIVAVAVSVSLNFAPVRAMASEFLSIFRVNNIQTVTISPDDFSQIQKTLRQGTGKVTLGNLGAVEMTKTGVTGGVTLAEAKESVDFPLLIPGTLPTGNTLKGYQRMSGSTFNFTLDTQKTNDILKGMGATTLLPDTLNGKTFTAKIPVVISATYDGPENLTIIQTRSPQLTAPSDIDINAIRDAILALPFLPEDLRRQLASINDWQHTFVVPNLNGSTQTITVAGSSGVFITSPDEIQSSKHSAHNTLLWQKDGVIYAITGDMTLEQGLSVANSMK
ncbi:MAG: hypothetical protein P4L69_13980 [Desulfosporosinus sp.]|nr:hypothetical protein [Desulfosporosinus sp.]